MKRSIKMLCFAMFAGLALIFACLGASEVNAGNSISRKGSSPYFYQIIVDYNAHLERHEFRTSENGDGNSKESYRVKLVDQSGKTFWSKAGYESERQVFPTLEPSVYTCSIYFTKIINGKEQTLAETFTLEIPLIQANKDYKNKFSDLKNVTKARQDSIRWMYQYGITTGSGGKNTYKPQDTVNRGSMAQFLHRFSASVKTTNKAVKVNDISNLPKERQDDIKWLAAEKITVLDKGNFNPNNSVNRGAMAELLYKTAGSPKYTPTKKELSKIKDISKLSQKRQKAIAWLAKNNITVLDKKGNFNPNNPVNRGSMAQFMQKLYKNVITKPTETQKTVSKQASTQGATVTNKVISDGSHRYQLYKKVFPVGTDTLKVEPNTPTLFLGIPGLQRKNITSITFDNHKPTKCTSPYSGKPIDVGQNKKKEVMACVSKDKTKVLIGEDAGVAANPNSQYLFYGLEKAPTLTGFTDKIHNWGNGTSLKGIFQNYGMNSTATSITIPAFPALFGAGSVEGAGDYFNRHDVNMSHMFEGFGMNAKNAKTVTLPEFTKDRWVHTDEDYDFVCPDCFGQYTTDISYMFANFAKGATSVKTVTIPTAQCSGSATCDSLGSNATNFSHMFDGFGEEATSATAITLPAFPDGFAVGNTAYNFSYMFANFGKNAVRATKIALPILEFSFRCVRQQLPIANISYMFYNFAGGKAKMTHDIVWRSITYSDIDWEYRDNARYMVDGINWNGHRLLTDLYDYLIDSVFQGDETHLGWK